ncbi:MAG: SH3 domain-containing protein [bacterium]
MKQILLALISLIIVTGIGYGENKSMELFWQANQYYKDEDYTKAISLYQQIIDSGVKDGVVFYNLGNALLKNGQLGKAILSYERAKRVLPRDKDIKANLTYANLLTIDKLSAKKGLLTTWISKSHLFLNINEQTVIIFIIYLLITALIILYIFIDRKNIRRLFVALGIILLVSFLILLISVSIKIRSVVQTNEAIVIVSKVEVKSGPEDELETIFFIHEGTKVKIEEVRGDWYQIELLDGKTGWISGKTVEQI